MHNRFFYSICISFILGIFLASFLKIDFYFNLFLVFLSFICFLFFYFIYKNKVFQIIFLSIFIIFLGIFYFNKEESRKNYFLDEYLGKEIIKEGIVINEIEKKENTDRFVLEVKENNKKVNILISVDKFHNYNYGDKLKIEGKLNKVENFINEYGKEFDYINYLKKDNILYTISFPKIEIISYNNGNFIKKNLFYTKNSFLEKINKIIPPYESTLLGGLILGERSSFPEYLKENFIKTGTMHIVALSGYNISIVSDFFIKLFYFFSINFAIYGAIISIILFIIMTGGIATSIRAGIMAIIFLIARHTGRTYYAGRALILACILMILINPYVLVYDISFQLSFLATFAVIFFTPKIEKYFYFIKYKYLRDTISITTGAYIFVLPFILYNMGNLSIVALPTNILILPIIPIIMLFGFLTGLFGFISDTLALFFGYISYLLLNYQLSVINFFASLEFSVFFIPNFPLFLVILIYLYFIYIIFKQEIKKWIKGLLNKDKKEI